MKKDSTVTQAYFWASKILASNDIAAPHAEAEYLLAHALKCDKKDIIINHDKVLNNNETDLFKELIDRRLKREPSQHIIGEEEFWGLTFKVNKDVLIPRPETQLLVKEALNEAKKCSPEINIIDLCTGSGCIAISMAHELPESKVYAIDISANALEVARENAKRHGVDERITFCEGDLFNPIESLGLKGKIDLFLSNPPYVSKKMMEELQPEIELYEPVLAVAGGEDGFDYYRKIIPEAALYIKPGGFFFLEIGYGQTDGTMSLIEQAKVYKDIEVMKDFADIDRVFKMQRDS
ncbi:MAG: peptide chain release factor N(5)-glutamine methyltransferase [Candidatus Pacebacteria bacterium]|jgi:release factor glutamine methyltransferase|nr:peptide chain release factor N(5)-glutamine methyltransferase [Candidatus Paceibacterota bacterium]